MDLGFLISVYKILNGHDFFLLIGYGVIDTLTSIISNGELIIME